MHNLFKRFGAGIFAIGYTIGTGSVTAMVTSGARHGLGYVWVLALSCLFSGVLMEAYGRFAAVTGETSLAGMRHHLKGGKVLAWTIFVGVTKAQYACMGGILAISAGAIAEMIASFVPSVNPSGYGLNLGISISLLVITYAIMMIGRFSLVQKILAVFVLFMGLSFIGTVFVVWPETAVLKRAAIPIWPNTGEKLLLFASFVGTTLAAPTFVTRPLIVRANGFDVHHLKEERWDAIVSAFLTFLISGAIVFAAAGALYAHGKDIVKVLDMGAALEPFAGRCASAVFMAGLLAAGISSMMPIMMVAPLLLGDYREGRIDVQSKTFRSICFGACLFAMIVPATGGNPIVVTIAAQVANVFVLPLTVIAIMFLINRRDLMGEHRAGWLLNTLLVFSFLFSCGVAWTGIRALTHS